VAQDYGKFECPVCGREVYVLLPLRGSDDQGAWREEITCPKGHTDTYDLVALRKLLNMPSASVKAIPALAGVG
jgi:hypothetical protein